MKLEADEREQLQRLVKGHNTAQQLALRARIILLADEGKNHREIARQLQMSHQTARLWRQRWFAGQSSDMEVIERLQDEERSGAPATFEPEQVLHLFKLACDAPSEYGRPISQFPIRPLTNRELADELIKQCIVETISPWHVGRLLAEADLKPHQSGYWLNPPDPDFDVKVKDICAIYPWATEADAQGERTICLDEMTGIQALERKAPDLPMRPGKIRRREFEYIRHGTQSLIISFDVPTGQVIKANVGQTRTEADYLAHVQQTLATDPKAKKWNLIMDCLNIHQSESLVRYIS